jgi:hypothetical protein
VLSPRSGLAAALSPSRSLAPISEEHQKLEDSADRTNLLLVEAVARGIGHRKSKMRRDRVRNQDQRSDTSDLMMSTLNHWAWDRRYGQLGHAQESYARKGKSVRGSRSGFFNQLSLGVTHNWFELKYQHFPHRDWNRSWLVEILCKSCFCECMSLESVTRENDSKSIRIDQSALYKSGWKLIVIHYQFKFFANHIMIGDYLRLRSDFSSRPVSRWEWVEESMWSRGLTITVFKSSNKAEELHKHERIHFRSTSTVLMSWITVTTGGAPKTWADPIMLDLTHSKFWTNWGQRMRKREEIGSESILREVMSLMQ